MHGILKDKSVLYFICLWLCRVFVAVCRLSLVVASRGYCLVEVRGFLIAAGFSSCGVACGIFSDKGLNLHPLHWQMDS